MRNRLDILDMIKRLTLFVLGHSSQWLTGINSLENAETTKILQRHLQALEASRSSNKGSVQAGMIPLLLLSHARQLALAAHARMGRRLDGLFLDTAFDSVSHGCLRLTTFYNNGRRKEMRMKV